MTPEHSPYATIYQHLLDCDALNRPPPTIRELCQASGLASTSSVNRYLDQLEADGLIVREFGKARSIRLVHHTDKLTRLREENESLRQALGQSQLHAERLEERLARLHTEMRAIKQDYDLIPIRR